MQIENLAFRILRLNGFLDKTLSLLQTCRLQNSSLTTRKLLVDASTFKYIGTHEMDAKYASGMNVSYLKSFEKKYSFGFEVSE